MYTLIIFTILSVIQFIYILIKWQDIKDYQEMAVKVSNVISSGKGNHIGKKVVIPAKRFGNLLITFLSRFKKLLIIPFVILSIINLVVSIIISTFVVLLT